MAYNWQLKKWPQYTYNKETIGDPQLSFGLKTGEIAGMLLGLSTEEQNEAIIDLMVAEAIKTSEIEGEFLSRQEVMSSIKKTLGVHERHPKQIKDHRAKGIAQLMVSIRKTYKNPLSAQILFDWHNMLMLGNKYIHAGQWRTHASPMQVISGTIGKETVHFEAPPSSQVDHEMQQFIDWFNATAPGKQQAINNPIVRSAIAHWYFESIHPFEDGNGRIGRAISEKALSQGLGQPALLSLSSSMETQKDHYYKALKQAQRTLDLTKWISYFTKTVLSAQLESEKLIRFSLEKTKFFDRYKEHLNERQVKVINRMFQEGPDGFEGGMTAKKYMGIAKTSKATATRDLHVLVELGVLVTQGGGRSVRYGLKIEL